MDKNKRKLGIINNFIILLTCLILILFVLVFDTPLGKSTWNGLDKQPIVDGVFLFIIYGLICIIWFNVVKALFYFIVSFWGLKKYKRAYPIIAPEKKFEIIIPACNEEEVIVETLEHLLELNYDSLMYKITVIADNCKDDTAKLAEQYPVKVFKTFSNEDEPKGKPHAIRKYIETNEWQWADFIVILDADNIIDKNYLIEMNSQLCFDDEIICSQGYLGVKNVDSSFVANGYATAYLTSNKIYQLAKERLGWNTTIGGTGFALASEYIKKNGWNPKSYTEDFELQIELSIQGAKTSWNHLAIIYDEKPNHFKVSNKQRTRWAQGHWFVGITTTIDQFKSFFKSDDIVQLMSRIEAFFYSYTMIPPHLIVSIVLMQILDNRTFIYIIPIYTLILLWVILDIYRFVFLTIYSVCTEGKQYISEKKGIIRRIWFVCKSCFALYVNSFLYMVVQYFALFTAFKPQNSWVKTVHSVSFKSEKEIVVEGE